MWARTTRTPHRPAPAAAPSAKADQMVESLADPAEMPGPVGAAVDPAGATAKSAAIPNVVR